MKILERAAKNIILPINPTIILILGIYTVVWGVWLIMPWAVFTHASLYMQMAHLAPEWVWGAFAVAFGTLTLRGALKPSYQNLHVGSFVGALFWLAIAIFFFMGDIASTGGITALFSCLYGAVVFVNVKINKALYTKDDN